MTSSNSYTTMVCSSYFPLIFSSGQFTGHIYQPGAWVYSRAAGNATVFWVSHGFSSIIPSSSPSRQQVAMVTGVQTPHPGKCYTIAHGLYIKILSWLRGFLVIFSIFGLVFFVLKSLLGIARQWSRGKFVIWTLKPWSHVKNFNISNVGY